VLPLKWFIKVKGAESGFLDNTSENSALTRYAKLAKFAYAKPIFCSIQLFRRKFSL
jgi:hypothetical protein